MVFLFLENPKPEKGFWRPRGPHRPEAGFLRNHKVRLNYDMPIKKEYMCILVWFQADSGSGYRPFGLYQNVHKQTKPNRASSLGS